MTDQGWYSSEVKPSMMVIERSFTTTCELDRLEILGLEPHTPLLQELKLEAILRHLKCIPREELAVARMPEALVFSFSILSSLRASLSLKRARMAFFVPRWARSSWTLATCQLMLATLKQPLRSDPSGCERPTLSAA